MRRQLLVLPGCLHENAGAALRLTGRGIDSGVGRDREREAADLPLVGGLLNVALDDAFERELRDWLLLVARRGRRRYRADSGSDQAGLRLAQPDLHPLPLLDLARKERLACDGNELPGDHDSLICYLLDLPRND